MAGNNILDIDVLAVQDDSIIRKEIYPYAPYTTTFNPSDEIRIIIQDKDSYLLPCESFIYMQIECTTTGAHGNADEEVKFVNNFATFLFSDARYELNGVEIDCVRNVGRASTMKLLLASRTSQISGYYQFCKGYSGTSPRRAAATVYDIVLPLSALFGFCDDYRKIVLHSKHELILNRSRLSLDCTTGGGAAATAATITIAMKKIEWKMPHVTLSDHVKAEMLNYISANRKIAIQHRSMDMIVYPQLPQTTSHMWAVKTVSHMNRPRYVVVGFQTNRKDVRVANATLFDHCNVTDLRLHINSQIYPYNMNELNITDGKYAELYHLYTNIQSSYYNGTEPLNLFNLSIGNFQSSPLFAFDTSRADESLINSSVDIRIEIRTRENMPANTAAYCLIIYDNQYAYSPLDGIVMRKI